MGWSQVGTIGGATGTSGVNGSRGQDGNAWLIGQAAPAMTQGKVGDLYFQTTKAGGGAILIPGPQGQPGQQGIRGPSGLNVGSDGGIWTPPNIGQWTTLLMKNGATFSAPGNSLSIYGLATTNDDFSMVLKPVPATPYSCIFYLKVMMPQPGDSGSHSCAGVCWRDSATNNVKSLDYNYQSAYLGLQTCEIGYSTDGLAHVQTDITTFGGKLLPVFGGWNWFRLRDDGTNQTYSISQDGLAWIQLLSEVRNTHVTPNQVGFFANPRNTASCDMICSCWSYQETG